MQLAHGRQRRFFRMFGAGCLSNCGPRATAAHGRIPIVAPRGSRADVAKRQIAGRGASSTKISRFPISERCAVGTSNKAVSNSESSHFKASKLLLVLGAAGAIALAFALRSMQGNAPAVHSAQTQTAG